MADLVPELAESLLAHCQQHAAEIATAIAGAADREPVTLTPAAPETLDRAALDEPLTRPGLALVFQAGERAAVLLLPENLGLLPEKYTEPDAEGEAKLAALAEQLGPLLLPEVTIDRQAAVPAESLAELLTTVQPAKPASHLKFSLGEESAALHLVWPVEQPGAVLPPVVPPEPTKPAEEPEADDPFAGLPPLTRSLLRIRVPVMVVLASKKQSVRNIVELGPGSIIKFDKSCDEMLELEVGGRVIAEGEAVKVGDKFGLRISSMVLPGERFDKLQPPRRKQAG